MIKTNIIISQAALSSTCFKESVDFGLVCAAFDHEVSLIFKDYGIFNLLSNQSSKQLRDKTQVDILKGLEFYDIENIVIEKESLEQSTLQISQLLPSVKMLSRKEICISNLSADHLIEF